MIYNQSLEQAQTLGSVNTRFKVMNLAGVRQGLNINCSFEPVKGVRFALSHICDVAPGLMSVGGPLWSKLTQPRLIEVLQTDTTSRR